MEPGADASISGFGVFDKAEFSRRVPPEHGMENDRPKSLLRYGKQPDCRLSERTFPAVWLELVTCECSTPWTPSSPSRTGGFLAFVARPILLIDGAIIDLPRQRVEIRLIASVTIFLLRDFDPNPADLYEDGVWLSFFALCLVATLRLFCHVYASDLARIPVESSHVTWPRGVRANGARALILSNQLHRQRPRN